MLYNLKPEILKHLSNINKLLMVFPSSCVFLCFLPLLPFFHTFYFSRSSFLFFAHFPSSFQLHCSRVSGCFYLPSAYSADVLLFFHLSVSSSGCFFKPQTRSAPLQHHYRCQQSRRFVSVICLHAQQHQTLYVSVSAVASVIRSQPQILHLCHILTQNDCLQTFQKFT